MSRRKEFTDYEKKTVYANNNGKCAICGKPVMYKKMTVDHKVPLSKGGTNDFSNLQLAHLKCNRAKSDLTDEEFVSLIRDISSNYRWNKIKYFFSNGAV